MGKKRERMMTDGERALLGSLRDHAAGWTATRVAHLATDDAEVAKTYGDMLEKRREMHPQALTPPTLGELFGLASAYLARSGRQPTVGHLRLTVGTESAETHFGAVGSPLFLSTAAKRENDRPAAGDILLLVSAENAEALSATLGRKEVLRAAKWSAKVGEHGILPTLLPQFGGILFAPERLDGIDAPSPLGRLFVPLPHAKLLLVDGKDAERVKGILCEEAGVTVVSAAALTEREEMAFAYSAADVLRVPTAQLRALPARKETAVAIPAENSGAGIITRIPVAGKNSPYLESPAIPPERVTENGLAVASAVRSLGAGGFRAAMATVLAPLLSLAAAGADYPDIRLGIGLRLPTPTDAESESGLAASILGIYRAQMEFATPAALFAETDDSLTAPELTVWAVAENAGVLPPTYRAAGNGVFCVTPVMTEAGIPDFALLRRLLTEVRTHAQSGKLFSARLAVGETLGNCIARTAGNGLTCRLADAESAGHRLPLGLIMEGTTLPYSRIGTAATELSTTVTDEKPLALPERIGKYIWSDRYEITVLSRTHDAAAVSLAAALCEVGADCKVLTGRDGDGPISRRILTSRILILCPEAVLPQDAQTVFALRMLTGNGGLILRLGETAPTVADFASLTISGRLGETFLRGIATACGKE